MLVLPNTESFAASSGSAYASVSLAPSLALRTMGREQVIAVFPRSFGQVHGLICKAKQLIAVNGVSRINGQSDTGGDAMFDVVNDHWILSGFQQTLNDRLNGLV